MIVLGTLTLPALLYSTVPDGPVKAGDVVFSTERHRVYFMKPEQFAQAGYSGFCLLNPRDQLLIIQHPAPREDGALVARIIGQTPREFPLCPPQAEVVVKPHQVTLKVTLWSGFTDLLTHVFSP